MKLQISTQNSEETEKIAEAIGKKLKGGEVIELVSDLGGGKTTFTRGLARGIGSADRVASPTFTISKVYEGWVGGRPQVSRVDAAQGASEERKEGVQGSTATAHRSLQRSDAPQAPAESSASADEQAGAARKLWIRHFDFYRLQDAGLMEHEIHDVIGDPEAVVVVEWGDVIAHVLPEGRLTIHFKRTGDESRELVLEYPETLKYLVESL